MESKNMWQVLQDQGQERQVCGGGGGDAKDENAKNENYVSLHRDWEDLIGITWGCETHLRTQIQPEAQWGSILVYLRLL